MNFSEKQAFPVVFQVTKQLEVTFGTLLAVGWIIQGTNPDTWQEACHMLVLSRKLNQSIHLGQNITISVVRIKGNVVQLGIEAPKEVHILRSELLEREIQSASRTSGLAAAESEAASAGHHASEDQLTTDDDDPSELIAALRIISQTETVNSKPPTISLFTGS